MGDRYKFPNVYCCCGLQETHGSFANDLTFEADTPSRLYDSKTPSKVGAVNEEVL